MSCTTDAVPAISTIVYKGKIGLEIALHTWSRASTTIRENLNLFSLPYAAFP